MRRKIIIKGIRVLLATIGMVGLSRMGINMKGMMTVMKKMIQANNYLLEDIVARWRFGGTVLILILLIDRYFIYFVHCR
jgi:hypothetical protein